MGFKETLQHYKGIIDKEFDLFFYNVKPDDDFLKLNYSFIGEYIKDGKRLRPVLLIMAYKSFCDDDKILPASLSVELLHNSTLVHDDVMDEDDHRRGKVTVYKMLKDYYLKNYSETDYKGPLFDRASSKFSVSNAVLCGNVLYALGAECILNSDFPDNLKNKALAVYNDAHRVVCHGQFLDLSFEKKGDVTEKDYLGMAEKKTAYLFSASVRIGAILANASDDMIDKLADYANELAVGFQLIDDIMDISKEMSKGHEIGSDIKSGKKTLLVIKALEGATYDEKKILLGMLGDENATKEEIEKAISVIERNSLDYVKRVADKRIEKAKEILSSIDMNEESRKFFLEFADYMVKRER